MLAAADDLNAFIVRKERKEHGLQRWIEGPAIEPGERVLVVEDVVTSGGSLVTAIERVREEGVEIAGALAVLDRLAGGREAIEAALGDGLPYVALLTSTTCTRTGQRTRWPTASAPSRIRTCGLLLRRESLCPAELSGPVLDG